MDDDGAVEYREFTVAGRTFRVPVDGYYFDNNHCWAKVEGARAKVGVSDFVQKNAGTVRSFDPPILGLEFSLFDEICSLAAENTFIEVSSPVTGKVVAVNLELVEKPTLMNEEPYERGWVAELELADIEEDLEMLMDCERYFEVSKAKISGGPRGCPCTRSGALYRRPDKI